ncbi:phage baseplate assembly protein [Tatumella saanichensis]|uniref:phage baseplate assembly protein n=1 Tax=Tatumella saanichensis TaxID=480813 RepID=UPI0004A4957C|nr:tail protein [Tatumella saanichensis]
MADANDELVLETGGRAIQGWDRVSVTRGVERLPSSFSLSLLDLYPGSDEIQRVQAGEACRVLLDDDLVLTGYIDRWAPALTSGRHEIRASGRGKCQDLVDCSAEWPSNVISQADALGIASRLAAPYGITVTTDISDRRQVPQFTLNWGESAQEVIDRVSRWEGLLYYDLPDGNLFLTRAADTRMASGIQEGINVERAWYEESMDQRFSDYTGISMNFTPIGEAGSAGYDAVTQATARDPQAASMRYRNRIVLVESTLVARDMATECIQWEMNRRYGRSRSLRVVTDSWRDSTGRLWQPNTLIPVSLPTLGVAEQDLLLGEVTYLRDNSGTHAEMTLLPPAAFSVQPYAFYSNLMELT